MKNYGVYNRKEGGSLLLYGKGSLFQTKQEAAKYLMYPIGTPQYEGNMSTLVVDQLYNISNEINLDFEYCLSLFIVVIRYRWTWLLSALIYISIVLILVNKFKQTLKSDPLYQGHPFIIIFVEAWIFKTGNFETQYMIYLLMLFRDIYLCR